MSRRSSRRWGERLGSRACLTRHSFGDEAAFEVEIFPVVLVPSEGVKLETPQLLRRSVEQPALLGHLLQEERIGMVQHRQVDFAVREEPLQFMEEAAVLLQTQWVALDEDRQVNIASWMRSATDR